MARPETLAATIVRFALYAALALGFAFAVQARTKGTPLFIAFIVVFAGIVLTAALRVLLRGQAR